MKTQLTALGGWFSQNILPTIGIVFGLLAPIQWILLLVAAFIAIDTVFGVYTAKKLKKTITSRKLAGFIHKMLIYNIVIISVYALDCLLLGEFLLHVVSIEMVATKITAIALITTEVYSVDEKLRMLNKDKGLWFYLKRLLSIAKRVRKESKEIQD